MVMILLHGGKGGIIPIGFSIITEGHLAMKDDPLPS
jgi:hypothetical protein